MFIDTSKAVVGVVDRETHHYLGTGCIFHRGDRALTAAHVVGNATPGRIGLARSGMGIEHAFVVDQIQVHPTADVALLDLRDMVSDANALPDELFKTVAAARLDPFRTCGWPDLQGGVPIDAIPGPRLQTGTIERISLRIRNDVQHYWVAELSLRTRPGLSGAPVFTGSAQNTYLIGLVTESERHERLLEEIEEERADGKVIRQLVEVFYTGYALLLHQEADWLRDRFNDPTVAL